MQQMTQNYQIRSGEEETFIKYCFAIKSEALHILHSITFALLYLYFEMLYHPGCAFDAN